MTALSSYVLREHAHQAFLASRTVGARMRQQIEQLLLEHESVQIDFSSVGVTQSFTDELVGVLAYRYGSQVLQRLAFKGCTNEHKKILNFVVSHRLSTRVDLPRPSRSELHSLQPA